MIVCVFVSVSLLVQGCVWLRVCCCCRLWYASDGADGGDCADGAGACGMLLTVGTVLTVFQVPEHFDVHENLAVIPNNKRDPVTNGYCVVSPAVAA